MPQFQRIRGPMVAKRLVDRVQRWLSATEQDLLWISSPADKSDVSEAAQAADHVAKLLVFNDIPCIGIQLFLPYGKEDDVGEQRKVLATLANQFVRQLWKWRKAWSRDSHSIAVLELVISKIDKGEFPLSMDRALELGAFIFGLGKLEVDIPQICLVIENLQVLDHDGTRGEVGKMIEWLVNLGRTFPNLRFKVLISEVEDGDSGFDLPERLARDSRMYVTRQALTVLTLPQPTHNTGSRGLS